MTAAVRSSAMYQMQPPQPPKPPKKKLNLFQILILLAVFGFAGWYLYTALAPAAATQAVITAGTLGARYSGDCLIVRGETPYDAEGVTSVEYEAEEGSLVQRGTTICNVYSSSFSEISASSSGLLPSEGIFVVSDSSESSAPSPVSTR